MMQYIYTHMHTYLGLLLSINTQYVAISETSKAKLKNEPNMWIKWPLLC